MLMCRRLYPIVMAAAAVLSCPAGVAPDYGEVPPPSPTGFIIGGTEVKDGVYPFMSELLVNMPKVPELDNMHMCGASLVSPRLVMTAAHCVFKGSGSGAPTTDPIPPSAMKVNVGRADRVKGKDGSQRQIDKVVSHPKYVIRKGRVNNAYDIAFLVLKTPVEGARPAQLPAVGDVSWLKPGTQATVTGWGSLKTASNGGDPARLREVRVPFMSQEACKKAYPKTANGVTNFCAGAEKRDSCGGDSGGPLFNKVSDAWWQYGIVSSGDEKCGTKGGVYISTSSRDLWNTLSSSPAGAEIRKLLKR